MSVLELVCGICHTTLEKKRVFQTNDAAPVSIWPVRKIPCSKQTLIEMMHLSYGKCGTLRRCGTPFVLWYFDALVIGKV